MRAKRLELEITEGVFVYDTEQSRQALLELRQLGVGIAMDDFGTGYSSLSYLTRLPLTKLKVDRSFIADFPSGQSSDSIMGCVVNMSNALDLSVVAEGVETKAQVAALQEVGFDVLQGYFYGKPTSSPRAVIIQFRDRAIQKIGA